MASSEKIILQSSLVLYQRVLGGGGGDHAHYITSYSPRYTSVNDHFRGGKKVAPKSRFLLEINVGHLNQCVCI
jgi:hypothetical protein